MATLQLLRFSLPATNWGIISLYGMKICRNNEGFKTNSASTFSIKRGGGNYYAHTHKHTRSQRQCLYKDFIDKVCSPEVQCSAELKQIASPGLACCAASSVATFPAQQTFFFYGLFVWHSAAFSNLFQWLQGLQRWTRNWAIDVAFFF